MKKKYVKDLVIGETVDRDIFSVKEIGRENNGNISLVLSDNTGSINSTIPKIIADKIKLAELEGAVVECSGVILTEARQSLFVIKEIELATDYVPAEVFPGLPQRKVEEYIADIKAIKQMITHPGYRALVDACLTDENLLKLAKLPATIGYYGRYAGGALAATDCVTRIMLTSMTSYSKRGNGLTTTEPSWYPLIAASLLYLYGNIRFFTDKAPFRKTRTGVAMGYFPTLQSMIVEVIKTNNVPLSQEEIDILLNILHVSVSTKTEAGAISKDGPILRHIISLYAECDAIDWEIATHDSTKDENGYYYSTKLNRYMMA